MSERTLVVEALSESEQPSSDGARPIRTLEETGEIVGMTPAGVWKLEQRAQKRLRLLKGYTENIFGFRGLDSENDTERSEIAAVMSAGVGNPYEGASGHRRFDLRHYAFYSNPRR